MMFLSLLFIFLMPLTCKNSCNSNQPSTLTTAVPKAATLGENPYNTVNDIPVPVGYTRMSAADNSFAAWLRKLNLKKNKTVYTWNGQLKQNQQAAFAVVDISVGNKDLQQCADAVMRLRAEYLYSRKRFNEIEFSDNENRHYRLGNHTSRKAFDAYLQKVFAWCGSLSLSKQLNSVSDFSRVQPGDVLIKGGSPGHAMLVMDVAINSAGKKIFLLSQSYMPAQNIHIVVNLQKGDHNPWYEIPAEATIETPEWSFTINQLKRWP
jgi:hypothetical protein